MKHQYKFDREKTLVALALVVALLLRLYLAPLPGFVGDYEGHKQWSYALVHYGFNSIYDLQDTLVSIRHVDYPPLYLYLLKCTGLIYKFFHSSGFEHPTDMSTTFVKAPSILIEVLTALIIYLILRRRTSFKTSFFCMMAYAGNPAIIYNTALWGQVDAFGVFFAVLSLGFLASRRFGLSVFFIVAGICMKIMVVVLLPLIFYVIFRSEGVEKTLKCILIGFLSLVLILLPIIFTGQLDLMLNKVLRSSGPYSFVSVNAYNLWRLTYPEEVERVYRSAPSDNNPVPLIPFLSFKDIGLILYGLFTLYILFFKMGKRFDWDVIFYVGFLLFFGFFMLPTRIHERYLFPVFALLIIPAHRDRKLQIIYVILTLTYFINLTHVLTTYFNYFGAGVYARVLGEVKITAFLNTLIFFYVLGLSFNSKDSLLKEVKYVRYLFLVGLLIALSSLILSNYSCEKDVFNEGLFLSELNHVSAVQGYGVLSRDSSVDGNPILLGGRRFCRGLGTHSVSEIIYDVSGVDASRFQAWVGVDDEVRYGSVTFEVWGDSVRLFESKLMRKGDGPEEVDVSVEGVSELKLVVTDGGDRGGYGDHANWADAKLIKT